MKKAYLVHGWDGNPDNCWFPWLRQELIKQGIEAVSAVMPMPKYPDPVTWPAALSSAVTELSEEVCLVGHSIGCQAIMRYLAALPEGSKIAGVVLVAPWMKITEQENDADEVIRQKWRDLPIDIEKFKSKITGFTCIFSDNDDAIDSGVNEPIFKSMGAKTIIEHGKGHFSDDAGITELPSALDAVIEILGV